MRRVAKLREKTGLRLSSFSTSALDGRSVQGHIENFVGTVSVPMGIAGPLRIEFPEGTEEILAPMATTEGALVSSISRGALALSLSGGVRPRVLQQKMIRAPQFEFESLDNALFFQRWILTQKDELASRVGKRSSYARLLDIEPFPFGRTVHVRFVYSTGNAAGQNMTTFCTSDLCQWLLKKFEFETGRTCTDFLIEGNLSSDKKASFLSASQGRGHSVICEGLISEKHLRRVLNISVDEIMDRFHRSKSARLMTGVLGFNINVANVVAALFLATGQDMACVHESSIAELHLEKKGNDLYLSLLMPTLVVGTVGGGTALPSFRDSLDLLGCHGQGSADRLAMIIASFALALEISTMTAIGTDRFVGAHERHSRHLVSSYLKPADLTADFFQKTFSESKVVNIKRLLADNLAGHVTELAFQVSKKFSGMLAFEIEMQDASSRKAFLKVKPRDREIIMGAARMLTVVHPGLAELFVKNWECLPFKNCHLRELQVFQSDDVFRELAPTHFGSFVDSDREAYILIQQLIEAPALISPMAEPDVWTSDRIQSCLQAIDRLHARFAGKKEEAVELIPTLLQPFEPDHLDDGSLDLWEGLGHFVLRELGPRFPQITDELEIAIENFPEVLREISTYSATVLHYDFNPRNVALRDGGAPIIFDWEFAAWGPRQRDIFEFLIFASDETDLVENFSNVVPEAEKRIYRLMLREFLVRRLPFYVVMSQVGAFAHLQRILNHLEYFANWIGDV